jgi:hypothetical protein
MPNGKGIKKRATTVQEKNDMEKKTGSKKEESPAQLIDARIEELDDWRGEDAFKALIRAAVSLNGA